MRTFETCHARILDRDFTIFGYEDDPCFRAIREAHGWSEFDTSRLPLLVAEDGVCIDVGANVGMMSLAMAATARRGRVYAFEGSREMTEALVATLAANKLDHAHAFQTVIGHDDEAVKFFDMPGVRTSSFSVPASAERAIAPVEPEKAQISVLRSRSIDRLAGELNLERLDLLKIDVEGAELDVLEGARESLARFRPIVLLEFNSYTYTHIREIAPRRALRQILDLFDQVYWFEGRTGTLRRLENTEAARERFLHKNLWSGFVDDLLCCTADAKLVGGRPISDLATDSPDFPPPRANAGERRPLADASGRDLLRELGVRLAQRIVAWR